MSEKFELKMMPASPQTKPEKPNQIPEEEIGPPLDLDETLREEGQFPTREKILPARKMRQLAREFVKKMEEKEEKNKEQSTLIVPKNTPNFDKNKIG